MTPPPRCPAWLLVLLLLASALGFVGTCLAAATGLRAGIGPLAAAGLVAAPVVILACTAAGTAALRRDRFAAAAVLFGPPVLAGAALLWSVR